MAEVNVTRLINGDVEPSELSGSVAERGKNAGPETWANANAEASTRPVLDDTNRETVRDWFGEFGAWDDEERAVWTDAELDALVLQYVAGDLREMLALCPGDGVGDIDWDEAERLAHAGTIAGYIYPTADGELWAYLGS